MPRVSVVMPSYNHAHFIGASIRSILSQSMDELELIIVDDCSSDHSNKIISSFDDPRVIHIVLADNVGACAAMNIALSHCKSEIIAVCNSDDLWEKDKLLLQLKILDELPDVGAVFSDVAWIDDEDNVLTGSELPAFSEVFSQPNRSRFGWLRHLMETGNCLCHPSILIRREVYDTVGTYNNWLRQLPDLEMWLRALQVFEIHVMPDRLVRFRIHSNNTSHQSPANQRRTWREHVLIAKEFFDVIDEDNFYSAFGFSDIGSPQSADPATLLREKVGYLVQTACIFKEPFREIGIEMDYRGCLNDGDPVFSAHEFHALTASTSIGNVVIEQAVAKRRRLLKLMIGESLYEKVRALNQRRKLRRSKRKAVSTSIRK